MLRNLLAAATSLLLVSAGHAAIVNITTTGTVDYSVIQGDMAPVPDGAPVTMSFNVDSDVFTNSGSFPTRGYNILLSSFSMSVGGVPVPIIDPQPDGAAYFVLRNNDPAVDGFFISQGSVDFPFPLAVNIPGLTAVHELDMSRGFNDGTPFSSLNILDCLGTYTTTNLSSYYWAIGRFGNPGAEYAYATTTISVVPEPMSLGAVALVLPLLARRKRA